MASGEVLAINEALRADPWLINTDPYGQGWMVRIRLEDAAQFDQLMDEDTYKASATWEPIDVFLQCLSDTKTHRWSGGIGHHRFRICCAHCIKERGPIWLFRDI